MKTNLSIPLILCLVAASQAGPQDSPVAEQVASALATVSGDSLRGNLSFIASDFLQGRDTPSRGLDLAALYIEAQFRRAGLEPASAGGYLQPAQMLRISQPGDRFAFQIRNGSRALALSKDQATVLSEQALDLSGATVFKIGDTAGLPTATMRGKILALDPAAQPVPVQALAALQPAAFLETADDDGGPAIPRMIDRDDERIRYAGIPRLIVRDPHAIKLLKSAPAGDTGITISLKLPEPTATPVTVSNVAALLRGSDAALRDEYVLLTAHYDHIGRDSASAVFPGANDDGNQNRCP